MRFDDQQLKLHINQQTAFFITSWQAQQHFSK